MDSSHIIDIDFLMDRLDYAYKHDRFDIKSKLSTIEQFYYHSKREDDHQYIVDYIKTLNNVISEVDSIVKRLNIPYYSIKYLKDYLADNVSDNGSFSLNKSDYFPLPLYISATTEEFDTIGIMISESGKVLEIHEGNDEATPETIALANKLVNPTGKKVRIYASHDAKVVDNIQMTDTLPKNLYVSPYQPHARSYLDYEGKRQLFTGIININDISQESDLDWKTIDNCKIEKFRILS